MPLCFIEPQDAIRVIAESVGREARRQLLGELVRAWVDEIPEEELASHYAKAVADLDEHDLSMLAAWHASMEIGTPIANKEFLVGAFGDAGREPARGAAIAAALRGEDAFNAGVAEEQALETVLPWLSRERCSELALECLELYCWDRLAPTTEPLAGRRARGRAAPPGARALTGAGSASSSAMACAVSRKCTPWKPSSRAASTLRSRSSTNAHASAGSSSRSSTSA